MDTKHTRGEAWALDIEAWCKKAGKDLDRAARAIVITIFSGVIEKTPVDTGSARGNWQITYGALATSIIGRKEGRGNASARVASDVNRPVIGSILYLTNNLPYIGKLEYGGYGEGPKTSGGYSRQAPQGMVRVTVTEVSARVREGIMKGMRRG